MNCIFFILCRREPFSLVINSSLQAVNDEIKSPLLHDLLSGEPLDSSDSVIVTMAPLPPTDSVTRSYAASATELVTSAVTAVSSYWPWK